MPHIFINPHLHALTPYSPSTPPKHTNTLLAANENPFGTGSLARQAAVAAAQTAHRYPDARPLIAKLAEHHRVSPDRIIVANGSNDILDIIARTFTSSKGKVVQSQYSFVAYGMVSQLVGATIETVMAKDFGHDLDAMISAITEKTNILWIANPNNPTGTYLPPAQLLTAFSRVPAHCLIVLDEAYVDYLDDSDAHDPADWLALFPNLIIVRTFSKLHGLAGMRIGYALARHELIAHMEQVRQPFAVNSVALAAAAAALNDLAHIARTKQQNRLALRELRLFCQKHDIPYIDSSANFLTVDMTAHPSVYEGLINHGIATLQLSAYGLPGFIRVSTGTPAEMRRLIRTLKILLNS